MNNSLCLLPAITAVPRLALTVGLVLILFGCGSTPPPRVTKEIMLPRIIPGTCVPRNELDSVRVGEQVKAYTFGRYIDPDNPGVMYEKSIVYRLEESPDWNLAPNEPFSLPFRKYRDNRQKLINMQRPLTAELATALHKQRRLGKMLSENNALVKKTVSYNLKNQRDLEKIVNMVLVQSRRIRELIDQVKKLQSQRARDRQLIEKLMRERADTENDFSNHQETPVPPWRHKSPPPGKPPTADPGKQPIH